MGNVRLSITMSLDGLVAGLNQCAEHPLRIGGMQLHPVAKRLAAGHND